ncbi:strawberry notch C-terminal domain-containing protein [Segatella copri]|uniref:DdrB-like domain-containing protein n=1 Tax=Segatella copri TaxID=165179 RepID=A0A414YBZ9_9BACT|nr:strawberry notch C-terminal domain-containing protein [Segatella copri]RHH83626.1 hypothetical protein DW192_05265 [Segatella copri]
MAGDKFDQLYNALKADGAVTGTREHFKQFVYAPGKQGYHNRKQLYDALYADGAVSSKSYEEFAQRLGLHAVNPKPQQQKPVQPVKKLTMKQRAQEVAAQYRKQRQQKAQQPRTATASGTDYMQNWRLMHMRNDQMNPMQQAQASNARARMQRAQEQSARQEQHRATPISRSRITPTAKNFNETMQQLSTPEAKQARAKQQREDDARAFAQYEVEGNNFTNNDGKYGTIAPEIDSLVATSMKEADDLSWSQYQQALKKAGNDAYLRNKAWKDLQDNRIKNRQNVLADTLSSKLQEIYSQKGLQEHIMQSADKLNMGVEEYVDKYVTPQMMQRAQNILGVKNIEEILPQSATEYVVRRLSDSILGTLSAGQDKSREQIAREQEAMAIADGLEDMPSVNGYKANEGYKSGMGARFVSTAANMAMDSPILGMTGSASNMTVDLGKQVLMKGLAKAGVVKMGTKLTAQQLAFKAANMTMAQKIASGLVEGTAKSALNLGGYSSITAALGQASTGDDTSLSALGHAALEGFGHGATTGAMFGVSGAIMAPWVSKFGITGLEKSTSEKWLHGTQKFGATAAGLGVEAGTMMVADNITGDKDISFGTWLEDVVMVGAFKAGEPKNYAHIGNALYNLAHNTNPHFVIGRNTNGSPIAVDIRLTPDEKNELISSASGKNLMDAFVKVDRASKTAPRDPKYKTAYTDFMNDPDVSQSTKEKVNAAMGLFNTTRGRSYRSVNDVKNKQILEYTKNGTLLTRTSYKNADERRAILYKQKLYRDNDDMMSLIGYSKMKDMQLTDEDGNVTSLALGFLRNNGYDTSKDVTDPINAQLINDLRNPKSALYLDWEKYVDVYGSYGDLKVESADVVDGLIDTWKKMINDKGNITVDIDNIMRKDPMKRTDQENKIFYYVKSELENRLFPSGKPHADQSASQGKTVAEEHSLGTDNPDSGVVVDELRNLRNAEQALDAAMDSNDVFKQTFEKLHQQGLTPAQIYDALIQNGLTQEELTPLAQYINANARVQGMQQATADAIEENVKSFISDWSYHGTLNGQAMNGEQALYVQDSNGRTLLVGSGDVAFDQTTGRAKEGSGDMLVCLDPNTKELVYVKADEVTLVQNQPLDQFAAEYRQRLQMKNSEPYNQAAQEQAMQDAAKPQPNEQEAPQDNTTKSEDSTTKEGDLTKDDTTLTKVDTTSGEDNTTNENLAPQEQPQQTRKFADGSDVPMATDSKGRPTPDYASMTPEQSAEILTEDFGENAEKVVDGQIKKAENALKDAEKMKVDYTAEPNDIMEQETMKNQTIEAAKKQLDHAQNIKKTMTAKNVAETVGKTEQTEGAHEAGSVAGQKFVNAPRLVGNKRTRMLPDGETKIKGHYEIVPAESLTPSHDVNNDYKKSEGFPTDAEGRTVNDRDYEHDKAAQQNTDQIARKYNGMAIEQVPVVSDEGIVYDGNGRTMAGQKAAKEGTDSEYINDLLENAENFGFTREQIEQSGIEHPRLVLVTDERLPYDTATFSKFNRNEKKTQSNTEQAVAKAKTLTSDEVGAIVAEIEGNGSLDAFFNNSKAINDLVKTLVDKGIIGQNEVAQMMDSPERLSAQGREYVKNLLLGSIFKPETIRMLGIDSTVKNKTINAIRSVMDNMKLGEFSLRDEIDQAIQLLYEARQGGNKVDTLLRTPDMFGEDAAKRYSSISQMMALALEGKVSDFRDLLDEYNRIAKARNTGEGNMFEAAPTKEELINEYLNFKKWQDYGTGHSEIEGGNDVSGNEKPKQEASGGNEPAEAGTEPERPRVEEPDDLVNKELESRIKVTDEETETPSKNGPIMKQKILIDGDKEVIKVDEPNEKGEYTGSYYEYDGKKYGDLNGVLERIDDKTETSSEEMPEGPIYDRKKALLEEIEKGGIKKKDDAFQLLYKADDLLDDYLGIPHDEWKPEPSRSNTIAGILSMARNALDRIKNEPVEPATEKQLSYLERLTSDDPTTRKLLEGVKLNKKQATWLIGNIKGLDDNLMRLHPDDIAETEKFIHDGIEYMKKLNGETSNEGGLPLLPKEEKPDPTFDPIAAAAAEFKKEHPLTEDEIMKADVDDLSKDMALDYLNGEVTDDLHRAIYESIFAKTRGQKTEPKVETPKAEPSADPIEGIKNAAEGFEKEKKAKVETEKKPQQTADDAAVAASNKKVNDLWDMLKNAGKDEISASFVGLNSRQLEVLPKLVSAMAENAYLRIKRGMHNLEDVVKEMRKEFAPAAKLFKKEDVDAIYEQMMNIRYRDGEQRMSLKDWADYYEKTSPKHQENLAGDSKTAEERKMAEKKFIDSVNLQLAFKHKFNGIIELRKIAERVGLKDIKDTDLQELAETAIVKRARGIASSESTNDAVKFERIKTLYENQPSLNQRDSERVMKQQYSTPAPYAFLADMYVKGNGKVIDSALEPSAGNGMLTIGLPMDKVHVNDIDAQRLANLRRQGFKNVTSQDGTQPFADKDVDAVVTNPPFGSATPKEYDGYKISSLEGQMAINALESMKNDGRAAIIIGGKTEYAKNGSLNPKDKAFLGYLYSHYNVEDVINVDGGLYAKQGTSYPTRIILINGRRLNENVFPPVKDKARAEAVKDYDELYKRIEDDILRGERMDSSIGGETRSAQPEPDKQGAAGTPKERVPAGERGGSKPDGKRESDLFDSTSVSGTHDDLENQRGTEPREDGGLPNGDSRTDGTGAEPSPSKEPTTGTNERRGNGSGGAGRNDAQPSTDEPASTGSGSGPRGQLQRVDKSVRGLSTEKVTYTPKSGNPFTLKAVMPADQQEAVNKNLEKLGDADQFLVDELGYNDKDDLYSHLAAEQVDSVALALQQAKKGNAFIIGDMTGIGKGRQAASLIRYAKKQGQVPVYFTKAAGLLSDVYRDLVDIGSPDLRPFVFGSAKEAAITDSDGKVVFALPSKSEVKRVLDYIEKNGKLPDEYDYVLTTYSQVSNGVYEFDEDGNRKERKLAKGKSFGAAALSGQRRRDAIEKLMDNAYLILDESHTAGGNSGQGNYFQHIIQKAKNVTFFSATFAKRPDNMPIYALRTAMNEGGMKSSDLIDAVKRGGATLQEIMSQTLTQCGQMIRRERDMTGVTIDWKAIDDPERVQEQREQYDSIIGLFNDIINFQKKYVSSYVDERNDELAAIQSTMGIKKGTAALGIKNQPFASKAFNTVQQVLLSLKAKSAAERAIDYLKQGMKPVIALNNTNESQTGNLALGEEMDAPDLGTSLKKGLEGTLRYTQKDAKDNSESGYIKLSDLGDEAVEAYHELEKKIEQTSTGLSLSPIDVIKNELQKAGYKVGELTGRQTEFVYNDNGTVTKVKRADTDKKKLARDFNDGKIDALILNKSAATGISLHASSKYKDQKKRVMIVAQQQLDVNDEVQMRGRIDRTGQVARGAYEYVVSLIPAEQRLLMMFKAKLKSLDANTTSSQKSKFNEMEVADITNKYGDKVVREYMAEHLDLYARMADPFGWEKSNGDDLSRIDPQTLVASGGGVGDGEAGADVSKLLGRMALLRVSEQEKMLQEIGELYANEIQRLNEMGENDLEITELPLKAKTLHKEVWKQGSEPGGDNAFADNTYIEKVNMAILKKPMKASEVKASQEGLTGGKTWDEYKTEKKAAVKEYFDQKIADETQKYEERAVKAATKAKEKYIKDAKKGQKDSGMSDEQIEKMAGYQYANIYKQEKDKLNDVVKNLKAKAEMFERVLDTFDTNQTFVLPTDMNNPNELSGFGNSYGRLIDIKITDNYSPNASSVSFATLDGRRKITFPIAGKVGSGENKMDIIGSIDRMTKQAAGMGDSHLRVLNQDLNNWDRLTSNESRKNGYIVTGNLMQALVDSKDHGLGGQLVKYTTDTGEVKTGILMPDRFDPKGLTTDAPINSVTEKFELSSWHGGIDEVTSSDGEVKVKRIDNNRGYYFELRVPKSKAKGGKYFMDEDLLKLVNGNNFETRGNNMLAEFKPEQLKPVLDRLSKMGVKVQEERKTSEDEGTHFREDQGLQYSKTDTKDVKNSRIIPEDVDKNVSSQIEKRFDDEVERLYGSISDHPNVKRYAELMANKFANNQYVDTFDYDKKMQPTKKHDGLKTIIDSLDNKLKDIEKKYGIKQSDNIRDIERRVKEGQSLSEAIYGSRTNGSNGRLRNHAGGSDTGREGTSGSGERNAIRTLEGLRVLDEYKRAAIDKAAAERAREYLIERFNDFRHKYGLEEGDWASQDLAERIFNDNNSDKDVQKIFDRIRGLVEILGTKLRHGAESENRVKGYYNHPENFIHIDSDFLSAIRFTKQDLASTVCHEMLHVVTSDIINLYRKGYGDLLTESQRKAAKEVVDLYDEIKSYFDKHIGGTEPYALKNPAEMITELANPEWRKIAAQIPAQKGWFRRVFNAIKKMLGFHVDTTTDLDRLDKALENVIRNFDYERFQKGAELNNEIVESKVTDPEEIKRLEEEPKIKVYRAMQVIDGKLYPPMAASVGGKLVEANELGQWIRADENPDLAIPDIDPKTGEQKVDKKTGELKWKFKLDKGGRDATGKKATDINAAYNPYWHMSRSPLNDQFKSAWIRPNIVVVECETPVSELSSGYKADRAKDAVGEVDWKSGSVSGEVFKQTGRARKVILSRWCKPVRVLDDAEVAEKAKEFIGDAKVEIPENVLTPKQRIAFEKAGFKIGAPEKGVKKSEQIMEALEKGLTIDNTVLPDDGAKFRTDHDESNYPTSSVENHVENVAQKTGAKVNMVSSVDEITNKAAKAAIEDGRKITGWYDETTGEVHLYMPNIHDRYTAEKTIWHEVVGHKGMRELFGDERFDKFLRDVWYDLDKPENAALKKLVDEERKFNPLNIYDAIEEGIARLAEDGKGEAGFWNGIKNKVSDFLHEIGYRVAPNTKDVKYLLWLSKNLQKNPNDPYWKMRAEAVKYRLDHERMPAVVAHDGMFYGNDGKVHSMDNLTKAEWNEATDGEIHFRTTPSAGTALDRYHRSLDEHGYMFTESYMDNMLSLKKLMNAIVPDKKIEDIASSENPYILQNTMQGAMSDAAQMFERNVMKPLDKAMADVLDAFDGKKDDEKIRNFNLYMITKHGLERNREFFVRDFLKKMRMDEQKKQDADFLENSYYSDKEYLDNELKAGNIDLKEYYRQLDESIRNHFDADFEAGEHDYSGMHAIQEVAKPSDPYNDAEAIQSVMDSEAKMESIKKGAVKDYWDKVKAATQYSIDSDYKNGIISKELHGHVSNMFNWYVPLRKYDEATAEDTYGYITEQGDPKSYIGSTIMRARGHKYLSETNVLAQIGAMGNRAIKNGGMNAIRQAFARFVRNNSNNNLVTETRVWYADDPITHTTVERYPDILEDATADEINQIVADFNMEMKDLESKGLATKVYRRGRIGYKFQKAENKSQHIVDVKIAGRTHTFIINGNPRAAQALNGLLENSGAKGIMKPLSSISRMMAQLCTSYNPEFVMRNIMRDAEFASSNVTSKEGARYGALWAKYYAQLGLYKGASNISFKDLSGTTGLGLFAKYRNGTLDTSDKVQKYFKEFMENGGETGWVQIKNMQDWTKEYKKDVKGERSKIDKGGAVLRDFFFGNLANINEVVENIARFATYCASRDSNRSIIRSVYDAKEVSTNFNRHGSGDAIKSFKNGEMTGGKAAARWAYGFTASYLRHCSMFFNAGIQSTNLLVKNLKNHPMGTSINMLAIPFALGALAALGNNVLIASEDEKDRKGVKDPYGELPDYVRRNNLCIYKGGGEFVTIPLAIELRAFYGLGDLAAGLTFSPNVSGQKNPALDAVGCMSQLVPVMDYLGNSSAGKEPLNETIKAISPSALSPFVEWELNTDWKGAPIERRGDWNENSPAWQRAYNGIPDGYMAVNKWVNAQTNDVAKGNEDMLGNSFLDMVTNPSMLNHYIGGIGGGAATFTERAIGVIKHGSDTETKDIPFLRSLLYTPSEQSSLQRTKSKWYNYKDEMKKTMANVDRLKSKNVPIDKRISNIGEYYHFQNSKEAAKVRIIELAEKQMKRWKKLRDKSSDTESINFANQNIDRIMMDAVDELDRLE